jgi:glycosyltransferase involved in cell wall biosynthesis
MKRVLLPSDNRDYIINWIEAYQKAGFEVVSGAHNFHTCSASYDIVHHQWPEELCNWKPPTSAMTDLLVEKLKWWKRHSINMVSVNNLMPHGGEQDEAFLQYFRLFYEQCHIVTHFSEISLQQTQQLFPQTRQCVNIVTPFFNYERLLRIQKKRGPDRQSLGIRNGAFVILLFGTIRNWQEATLIREAYRLARIANKQLMVAGHFYGGRGGAVRKALMMRYWLLWLWKSGGAGANGYICDEDIARYMDSADVVVVPRLIDMNSAIPSLAMTFGKMVIAPNHGAFPEILKGTGNLLYKSGDARSLAAALEEAHHLDCESIGKENSELVRDWSWTRIVTQCVEAAAKVRSDIVSGTP